MPDVNSGVAEEQKCQSVVCKPSGRRLTWQLQPLSELTRTSESELQSWQLRAGS